MIRFKSRAYTLVREAFKSDRNTALEQKMTAIKTVLVDLPPTMENARR